MLKLRCYVEKRHAGHAEQRHAAHAERCHTEHVSVSVSVEPCCHAQPYSSPFKSNFIAHIQCMYHTRNPS